jgi:hypothetical protein
MKPDQRRDLQDCITYFSNHLHQMRYARYVENAIPIGSGVTELRAKHWSNNGCAIRECAGPQRARKSS